MKGLKKNEDLRRIVDEETGKILYISLLSEKKLLNYYSRGLIFEVGDMYLRENDNRDLSDGDSGLHIESNGFTEHGFVKKYSGVIREGDERIKLSFRLSEIGRLSRNLSNKFYGKSCISYGLGDVSSYIAVLWRNAEN